MKKLQILSAILVSIFVFQISSAQEKISKSGIVNGKAAYFPKPDYSQEAKDFCAEGKVEVEVLIGEDGNVISAEAVSGDELLRDSSVEAAKKAKFKMGHATVKTDGVLIFNFVSENKCIYAGIVNKRALSIPKPQLTNFLHPKHLRLEEPVEIKVQIVTDPYNGNVLRARTLTGHPLIRRVFANSARKAKFSPSPEISEPFLIKGIIVYKLNPDGEIETDFDNEIILGKAINLPKPVFPSFNGKIGNNRSVLVEIEIDENGNVISANAISGHPILKAACVAAARNSKFSQSTISGVPVKAKALLTYEYILADEFIVNVIVNSIEAEK